jgi:hypothetical protein
MKSSDIEPGFYYENKNRSGWLRFIVSIDGYVVLYADFTGYSQCTVEALMQWAKQRYSAEKAAEQFPKEVADIGKVLERDPRIGIYIH